MLLAIYDFSTATVALCLMLLANYDLQGTARILIHFSSHTLGHVNSKIFC